VASLDSEATQTDLARYGASSGFYHLPI